MSGDACAACDGAGRTEAMAMAAILTLIAIGVGFYIWLQLM